ncbi:hypothetical protein JAAARDRAFT_200735 [Jaapia argillacea MUCL 33604]|uniref:Uncharacterized protein n=1 Tax=Jaapia argillacea MUCL 33604 TaxID=933084 RepID=A0A067P492_9AGAM|nr:hypothetical protein JAAARDRAFT_200735 [Jaapia argillacea MUCL 33604]
MEQQNDEPMMRRLFLNNTFRTVSSLNNTENFSSIIPGGRLPGTKNKPGHKAGGAQENAGCKGKEKEVQVQVEDRGEGSSFRVHALLTMLSESIPQSGSGPKERLTPLFLRISKTLSTPSISSTLPAPSSSLPPPVVDSRKRPHSPDLASGDETEENTHPPNLDIHTAKFASSNLVSLGDETEPQINLNESIRPTNMPPFVDSSSSEVIPAAHASADVRSLPWHSREFLSSSSNMPSFVDSSSSEVIPATHTGADVRYLSQCGSKFLSSSSFDADMALIPAESNESGPTGHNEVDAPLLECDAGVNSLNHESDGSDDESHISSDAESEDDEDDDKDPGDEQSFHQFNEETQNVAGVIKTYLLGLKEKLV